MTARIHSAVLHRLVVPAWLLVVVLAVAIAATLVAVLDTPAQPAPLPAQAPASCLDSTVVGRC